MSEDEYRMETRARVILFLVIVALSVMIGVGYYINLLFPRSPTPPTPLPPNHMSPFGSP